MSGYRMCLKDAAKVLKLEYNDCGALNQDTLKRLNDFVRWNSKSDKEKVEWEQKAEEYEAMNDEVIEPITL
jgi:hypothetical protein